MYLLVAAVFVFSMTGCEEITNEPVKEPEPVPVDYPFAIDDITFIKAPETVISLSPALTEIIYEMGYGSKVVGRGSYCDYPEEVTAVTDVGSSANPDIDEIIKLKPELLITQSPVAEKDKDRLLENNIDVLVLKNPSSYSTLKTYYTEIEMIFTGASEATKAAEITLQPLAQELSGTEAEGTFVYIMTSDMAVATGDTLAGEILSYFGENIASGNNRYNITAEELAEKQPDYIYISSDVDIESLGDSIKGLNAYVNGKIIKIDGSCFERPTERTLLLFVKELKALRTETEVQQTEETTESTTDTTEEASETQQATE